MSIISLTHELALLEDQVRTDLRFIQGDLRPLVGRTEFTKGFDAAVLKYAQRLGLVEQTTDEHWRTT